MAGHRKTLVLDFDGVLHSYESGWQGIETVGDGPVPGAVQFILSAVGFFNVQVYSSRSESATGIRAMREALFRWIADETDDPTAHRTLDQIGFPTTKPAAFLAIDDRALTFDGTFPAPEDLLGFQPWNKRSPGDS